jgi:hypothetical protein
MELEAKRVNRLVRPDRRDEIRNRPTDRLPLHRHFEKGIEVIAVGCASPVSDNHVDPDPVIRFGSGTIDLDKEISGGIRGVGRLNGG